MAERRDLLFRLLGDSKSLQRASKSGETALQRMGQMASSVAGGIGIAFGVDALRQWGQEAFRLGSAAEEVDSKFQAVFGTNEQLIESLEAWGDMAGVTTTDAKNLAATFGNLAMAQGLSADETEALTKQVATLAGDLASFNDQDPSIVFNDLNKALLTTEREGMKKYGIAITEAEVKTRAAAIAVKAGRDEVTKADRALASYEIAVEQAGQAVGDLERTQDSAANQTRQLQASVKELQEGIGRALVPEVMRFVKAGNDTIAIFRSLSDEASILSDVIGLSEGSGLNKATSTLIGVLNPVGPAFEFVGDVIGEVKDLVSDTEVAFKEFGDTAAIIEADTLAALGARLRAVREEQEAYRAEVEKSYQPLTDYDAMLANIIRRYQIMQGLTPNWGDFGNPGYYRDGQFNPDAASSGNDSYRSSDGRNIID